MRGSGTAAAVGGCCRRGAIDGDAALAAEAAQQRTQLVGQRVVLLCDRNVIAQQRVIAGCVQVRQAGWGKQLGRCDAEVSAAGRGRRWPRARCA
ncbi:hypothetical protein FEO86_05285 [Stenotrophomonas maltophilia]|nr:hypothetical protein [Salmonella enterica]MBA0291124.1 hypothetical protein [Stenotrophomonas maltophilia]MBA0302692.1 hypothetical protein [Stenotrophomonas maltophilia]MBA0337151.1 hypothetical protein [Stenotrophomonas maltophilia]MBA0370465.1 hypothetical protein [Stenotrophomonas maltophilia]